jgi:hypothetical protein
VLALHGYRYRRHLQIFTLVFLFRNRVLRRHCKRQGDCHQCRITKFLKMSILKNTFGNSVYDDIEIQFSRNHSKSSESFLLLILDKNLRHWAIQRFRRRSTNHVRRRRFPRPVGCAHATKATEHLSHCYASMYTCPR